MSRFRYEIPIHYLPPAEGPVTFSDRSSVPMIPCGKQAYRNFSRDPQRVTCFHCRVYLHQKGLITYDCL